MRVCVALLLCAFAVAAAAQPLSRADLERAWAVEYESVRAQAAYVSDLVRRTRASDEPTIVLDVADLQARSLVAIGRADRAAQPLDHAIVLAGLIQDASRRAALEGQRAMVQFYSEDDQLGLKASARALAAQQSLSRPNGAHPAPDRMLHQLLDHASLQFEMRETGALAATLKASAKLINQSEHAALHSISQRALEASVHQQLGDLDRANALISEALIEAHALGRREWVNNLKLSRGDIEMRRFDYVQADATLHDARAAYLADGSSVGYAFATISLADIGIHLGDGPRALRYAAEAQKLFDTLDDPFMKADTRRVTAHALAISNSPERAARVLAEARALRADRVSDGWAYSLAQVDTQLALARGDSAAARVRLRAETALLERILFTEQRERLIATREVYNDNERELKVQVLSQENAIKALELERNRALINAQRLAMALGVTLLLVVTASLVFFVRRAQVLRVRANTDALTGALSRRAIEQRLEDAFAQPKGELSVLMFDLDHFKTINDRDGHAEGDRMLVRVVDAAQRNLREREVVGRLGGDEFLVVLPGADAKSALERAEAIRRALHAPAAADQKTPTISIGVATRAKHSDAHALVLAADRALLEAKQAGRDQIKVNEEPTR